MKGDCEVKKKMEDRCEENQKADDSCEIKNKMHEDCEVKEKMEKDCEVKNKMEKVCEEKLKADDGCEMETKVEESCELKKKKEDCEVKNKMEEGCEEKLKADDGCEIETNVDREVKEKMAEDRETKEIEEDNKLDIEMEEFLGKKYVLVRHENFEAFLLFLGKGYMARKAALSLHPEVWLTRKDETYTFSFHSILASYDITFVPGEEFDEVKPDGKVKSVINFEGNKMIHIQTDDKGRVATHVREFYHDKMITVRPSANQERRGEDTEAQRKPGEARRRY